MTGGRHPSTPRAPIGAGSVHLALTSANATVPHGTVLDECYRVAFHRRRFDRLVDVDHVLQDFVHRYNTRRANRGRYMKGRTPVQMLELKR